MEQNIIAAIPRKQLPVEPQTILRALLKRAGEVSNHVGHGVAVPHARLDGLDKPMLAFARSAEGVDLCASQQADFLCRFVRK